MRLDGRFYDLLRANSKRFEKYLAFLKRICSERICVNGTIKQADLVTSTSVRSPLTPYVGTAWYILCRYT